MATSNGNCFICGKTAGKTAIKNHVLKEHNNGGEHCYLLKAEGAYDKDYWLYFTVPLDASLSVVDKFLREIWCECCGHMSAFHMGGREFGKARKLSALEIGDTLLYEYDFGSTTEILLTVMDEIFRTKQKVKVQLHARNIPPQERCDSCDAPATYTDIIEGINCCDECAENSNDKGMLMLITNSPRSGECGYDGELDIWTFDAEKPFPQPQKPKTKRGGVWMPPEKEEIPAEDKWATIDKSFQTKLLENVFCSKCGVTTIINYSIENCSDDIVLQGNCAKCNGKVARLVEFE